MHYGPSGQGTIALSLPETTTSLTLHSIEPCRIALELPTPRSTLTHVIVSLPHLVYLCWVDVVAYIIIYRTTAVITPVPSPLRVY